MCWDTFGVMIHCFFLELSLDLKRKANRSKLAPDPHEMFWKPNINQGPIVEGTLEKKNYISLVFAYIDFSDDK